MLFFNWKLPQTSPFDLKNLFIHCELQSNQISLSLQFKKNFFLRRFEFFSNIANTIKNSRQFEYAAQTFFKNFIYMTFLLSDFSLPAQPKISFSFPHKMYASPFWESSLRYQSLHLQKQWSYNDKSSLDKREMLNQNGLIKYSRASLFLKSQISRFLKNILRL